MSLSLGTAPPSAADVTASSTYTLQAEEELRLILSTAQNTRTAITLKSGTAELFGSELIVDREYVLQAGSRVGVFSWHGSTVIVSGTPPESAYTTNDTPMVAYINTHAALENLRQRASDAIPTPGVEKPVGPIALIVGSLDSGKQTLSRILLNYAVRSGHKPLLVDLDPNSQIVSLPGSIGVTAVEQPISIADGDMPLQIKQPYALYYGHNTIKTSKEIYFAQIEKLASMVHQRLQLNDTNRTSGAIVKLNGKIDPELDMNAVNDPGQGKQPAVGYEAIIVAATAFNADVILVIGHPQIHAQLRTDKRLSNTSVVLVQQSNGVVKRGDINTIQRRNVRNQLFRDYFYGRVNELSPHTKVLHFREVEIYRTGGGPAAPTTALPIGGKRLIDPNKLTRLFPSKELLHSIMAVSYSHDVDALSTSHVAGFVYCSDVNMDKKTISLLTPAPGDLPSKYLLFGTLKWLDAA